MEHPIDSLSPYLDSALTEAELGRVKEHLDACPACAARLSELRSVSRQVSSLPRAPLPAGFLRRLERRAAREEVPERFAWLSPGPARIAAFAATAMLVSLVVYREVRFQRMRAQYETAWTEASLRPQAAAPLPMEEPSSRPDRGGGKTLRAPGSPIGVAEDAAAPSGAEAAGGAGPEIESLRLGARGEVPPPGGAGGSLGAGKAKTAASNDELQGFLDKEKERMGISRILPKASKAPPAAPAAPPPVPQALEGLGLLPDRPMSRTEAMAAVRQLTSQFSTMNRRRENSLAPVAVRGAEKPKLLASPSESRPMDEGEAAKKADLQSASSAGSIALAGGDSAEAGPAPQIFSTEAPPVAKARADSPVPAAPSSLPRLEEKPAALPWSRTWTGTGGSKRGGFVVKDDAAWASLWEGAGAGTPPPAIDFSKEMALAVFSDAEGKAVAIDSVLQNGPRLWVNYRLTEAKQEGGPSASRHHIVVVPRSELPVTFNKVH